MPKLLYYHELDFSGVKAAFQKVEAALAKGDFATADVKKMTGTDGLYRAKLDRSDRLLFKYAQYQGETYLLLLEVIREHAYDHSKFLRGAEIDERKFQPVPDPAALEADAEAASRLVYVNPKRQQFHLLDKVISFDEDQREIYALPAPLIIIGSAGSGKTALTLEKMKHFQGQVAYVSLSPYLVENAQRIYYAHGYDNPHQEIDFLSFEEFLQGIEKPAAWRNKANTSKHKKSGPGCWASPTSARRRRIACTRRYLPPPSLTRPSVTGSFPSRRTGSA